MPNGQQVRQMCHFAGSCRFVFNKALALQQGERCSQIASSFFFSREEPR
ncbi:MAG: helix-turn-helix domain-containing protein, partial [Thermochromatium sp.]